MNEKNFGYLWDQVKYTGLGNGLESELMEPLLKDQPEFELVNKATFGSETVEATLHFKKSNHKDLYYLNKYHVSGNPGNSAAPIQQTFYMGKEGTVTLTEAFNLLQGRAATKDLTGKEGLSYNAWLQLDFNNTDRNGNYHLRQYHQNYGFDIEKELAKFPIKERASESERTRLLESLGKGNRQAVTFLQDGAAHRMDLEANPWFKSRTVYDCTWQRVYNQAQKKQRAPRQTVTLGAEKRRKSPKQSLS